MEVKDKLVFITGASRGIGFSIAKELIKNDAYVIISSKSFDKIQRAFYKLKDIKSTHVIDFSTIDITNKLDVEKKVKKLIKKHGIPDIIIANAGISNHIDIIPNTDEAEAVIKTNLLGSIYTIYNFIPYFLEKKTGYIVGISSLAGIRGLPRGEVYSASKSGLTAFLEGIRIKYRDHNIKVSIVFPGFTDTDMIKKNDFYMPFIVSPEKAAKKIVKGIKKEKRYIYFPFPLSTTTRILKIFPGALYDIIIYISHKKAKNKFKLEK